MATSKFLNGMEEIGANEVKQLIALYGYNLTSMPAKEVVTQNTIGMVEEGEMVYILDAGEKGVLVLVGIVLYLQPVLNPKSYDGAVLVSGNNGMFSFEMLIVRGVR